MMTQIITKYPARCKSVDKNMSINMILTDEKRKNMRTVCVLYEKTIDGFI